LSGIGGIGRPGIVHRLDKDTSGLMVVAKNDLAHRELARQFEERTIERAYMALVWGMPEPREGTVTGNIGRSEHNRKKMAIVKGRGKHAVTHYKVLRAVGTVASVVECRLETGRTHQIRVHMASIGHPVVGDAVYGRGDSRRLRAAPAAVQAAVHGYKFQALHAYLLGFMHPSTGEKLRFEVDIHNEINKLEDILKGI
jgi:23S rRNA pseudouridine1911/1915/1917 synthase